MLSSKLWLSCCPSSPLQQSKLGKGGSVSSSFNACLPKIQSAIEKFTKKLLGEKDVESVLQRLDRLTQDEARMTVAQTLDIVYGLVGNVRVVMDGAQWVASSVADTLLIAYYIRWQGITRQHSRCVG